MTDQKHENLRRLFDVALTTPKEQRAAFLTRECEGDVELRARLEAMIQAVEDDVFLTSPTGGALNVANSRSDSLREGPGSLIGPYKLLQQIGEGGFGVVFLAEQHKPVARKLALKIIKLGMDTRQVVARAGRSWSGGVTGLGEGVTC